MIVSIMYRILLIAALPLFSQMPPLEFSEPSNLRIAMQNSILVKVNETTLSVMDVKKKMDMIFHQHYPNLRQSNKALCQFYTQSWRPTLMEMIDHELILADAAEREIKVSDAEVREALEERFGPNVLSTLDNIGLTYDEASKLIKNDLIVQRMSWWFIQSKAIQSVTPQDIRKAYVAFLDKNPPYQEMKYRTITLKGNDVKTSADALHAFLIENGQSPELLEERLIAMNPSIQVSSEYNVSDLEISEKYKSILSILAPGNYSFPIVQKNRASNSEVARIFYLSSKIDHPAPSFEDLSSTLRDQLIREAISTHSFNYVAKLRKAYGFDPASLKSSLPEDMHPFSLQ